MGDLIQMPVLIHNTVDAHISGGAMVGADGSVYITASDEVEILNISEALSLA